MQKEERNEENVEEEKKKKINCNMSVMGKIKGIVL